MDGAELLRLLKPRSAAAVFFDPQHRHVLDGLKFGNEGKRQKGRVALPSMSDEKIAAIVRGAARALRPGGYLFLWIDKLLLVDAGYKAWFRGADFYTVDMVTWDKLLMGMGKRTRRVGEYMLVIQKGPTSAKGWGDRGIRDVWAEQQDRARHPHAKPYQLIERLLRAVTKPGDLVVDPAAGSYVVLDACVRTRRTFVGCDLL